MGCEIPSLMASFSSWLCIEMKDDKAIHGS